MSAWVKVRLLRACWSRALSSAEDRLDPEEAPEVAKASRRMGIRPEMSKSSLPSVGGASVWAASSMMRTRDATSNSVPPSVGGASVSAVSEESSLWGMDTSGASRP